MIGSIMLFNKKKEKGEYYSLKSKCIRIEDIYNKIYQRHY